MRQHANRAKSCSHCHVVGWNAGAALFQSSARGQSGRQGKAQDKRHGHKCVAGRWLLLLRRQCAKTRAILFASLSVSTAEEHTILGRQGSAPLMRPTFVRVPIHDGSYFYLRNGSATMRRTRTRQHGQGPVCRPPRNAHWLGC
jgi:hypothetical protein